jgi:hypothetical protein
VTSRGWVLELAEDTKLETYPQRFKFIISLTTKNENREKRITLSPLPTI